MKKPLLTTALLLASGWCASQHILERTIDSWSWPNLSVERTNNTVIAGFTDRNPAGRYAPTFKLTTPAGAPMSSFYLDFTTHVVLMDFTIKNSERIVLVGSVYDIGSAFPTHLYVAECDFAGTMIQSRIYPMPTGQYLIPHHVVHSPTQGQIVVVGTKANGPMTVANTFTLPRTGFILGLNQNNFNAVLFTVEMNSPAGGTNDSDMLEAITEVPGSGYFITGSANNPTNAEQNLLTMGINYAGGITHSHIRDNTNSRYVGASVLYQNSGGFTGVHVLANNSVGHQWEVASFNIAGNAVTPFYRHQITTLPVGSGIDVNGFRLLLDETNKVAVGGYIFSPNPPAILPQILTPFLITLNPGLATAATAKMYRSRNFSPLNGYYNETGNSVFINTPDIVQYDPNLKKYQMLNPNTIDKGYDLHISGARNNNCESALETTPTPMTPVDLGPANYTTFSVTPSAFNFPKIARQINQAIICQATSLAQTGLMIAPNPATTALTVELTDGEIREITVIDMRGSTVLTKQEEGLQQEKGRSPLDISQLTPGMYLVRVVDEEGMVYTLKFLKE